MELLERNSRASEWMVPSACLAYALLLIVGFGLFRTRWTTPVDAVMPMSPHRAAFFVCNAATLSGFQTSLAVESLQPLGQFVLFVLMVAGGMLSWVVGGILVKRALRLEVSDLQIVAASGCLLLLAVVAGMILNFGDGIWRSSFNAVSAVTNCGLWIGPPPAGNRLEMGAFFLPLALLGGLGITVILELVGAPVHRALSPHAAMVLTLSAVVYLLGFRAVFCSQWLFGGIVEESWRSGLWQASALSINARSAGLPGELLSSLPRPTQWMVGGLMLIGGGSGGATGGLKLTTLAVLALGVAGVLRGRAPERIFGIAAVWLGLYLLLIAGTFLLLLGLVPELSADRLLMLSISAVGNVGLSHDVLSAGGHDGSILTAAMLAGRVMPLVILAWVARGERTTFAVA
ncbi:MAG: hypothetical protein RMJ35_01035 [Phycisphaerales bacterium]|nr:hypothetical protein [Phycisphaerales bacterium]